MSLVSETCALACNDPKRGTPHENIRGYNSLVSDIEGSFSGPRRNNHFSNL